MSNIRVTYSGLISLIGGIISIFTGIIFTLIITRSVTPEEYGTWGLIVGLITYVSLIGPIVSIGQQEILREIFNLVKQLYCQVYFYQ